MLRMLTAGESHGPGLVMILEGMPAGLSIDSEYIDQFLARRQKGHGRGGRMGIEQDRVQILAGVRGRMTLGSPIAMLIANKDYENWARYMSPDEIETGKEVYRPRPGHADLAGAMKYNHQDFRNVLERASARETAARVAAGAICRKFLSALNINIYSQVTAIGPVRTETSGMLMDEEMQKLVEQSPVGTWDQIAAEKMTDAIDEAKSGGESLGGVFEISIHNTAPGIGSHVQWDRRLDARLTAAMMSIPAIKAVEVGEGFENAHLPGSRVHDEIQYGDREGLNRRHNRAGGIEGGISNGEPIMVRAYMKPIPTLYKPLLSVNTQTWEAEKADIERSDICAVPAARIVGEAMAAFALSEALTEKFGADSMSEMKEQYAGYLAYLEKVWQWKRTSF